MFTAVVAAEEELYAEVIRLGDQLVGQMGLRWETSQPNPAHGSAESHSESLYDGVSGLLLFLTELYTLTKKTAYKTAVLNGAAWLINHCRHTPTTNYALYTGRMGVVHCLVRVAELTQDRSYLTHALKLAYPCTTFLDQRTTPCDLLNGASGTLLGLLRLYQVTGEQALVEPIQRFATHLLSQARVGRTGLYWDRQPICTRGLCGFAHGAAGIGFVFLELAHRYQIDAFRWLADQAYSYENDSFDQSHGNWPDFRKLVTFPGHQEAYRVAYWNNELALFEQPNFVNAWCHGAVGIGLSRSRAYALTGNERYKQDFERALKLTEHTEILTPKDKPTFTLCHGGGGNAELFLEAFQQTADPTYLLYAQQIAGQALLQRKTEVTYRSGGNAPTVYDLFLGDAGIGYFYLRLLRPDSVPSLLLMPLGASTHNGSVLQEKLGFTTASAQRQVVLSLFRRTILLLEHLLTPQAVWTDTNELAHITLSAIDLFLQKAIRLLPAPHHAFLLDVFTLEKSKALLDQQHPGYAYLWTQQVQQRQATSLLLKQADDVIWQTPLRTTRYGHFLETQWNWSGETPPVLSLPSAITLFLMPLATGVVEITIPPQTARWLQSFDCLRSLASLPWEEIDTSIMDRQEILTVAKALLTAGVLVTA